MSPIQVLKAVTLGSAVPSRNFDATVHSVFKEAANLYFTNARELLTLIAGNEGDLPQGIRIHTPQGFSFEEFLKRGESLSCREDFLRSKSGSFAMDLRGAQRWQCRIPKVDFNDPSVRAAWTQVWEALSRRLDQTAIPALQARPSKDGFRQTDMDRKMDGLICELVEAVRRLDLPEQAIMARLVGLGEGLTPAGDDFLVGFLTGLRSAAGGKKERLLFLSELGEMVVRCSDQTNDISHTYLYHASRGEVSSRLVSLAAAISTAENSDRLLRIAEEALRVGHSSGMETVRGLLIGLSVWGMA